MYQQATPVVHRYLLRITYTSLYGWRNIESKEGYEFIFLMFLVV